MIDDEYRSRVREVRGSSSKIRQEHQRLSRGHVVPRLAPDPTDKEQPGRSSGDELTIEDLLNWPTSEDESAA
jgi:hypothetical protein